MRTSERKNKQSFPKRKQPWKPKPESGENWKQSQNLSLWLSYILRTGTKGFFLSSNILLCHLWGLPSVLRRICDSSNREQEQMKEMLCIHAPIIQKKKLIAFLIAPNFSSSPPLVRPELSELRFLEQFSRIITCCEKCGWWINDAHHYPSAHQARSETAQALSLRISVVTLIGSRSSSVVFAFFFVYRVRIPQRFFNLTSGVLVRAKRVFSINIAIKLLRLPVPWLRRPFMVHCRNLFLECNFLAKRQRTN